MTPPPEGTTLAGAHTPWTRGLWALAVSFRWHG